MSTTCPDPAPACRGPCATACKGKPLLLKPSHLHNARRAWFYNLTTAEHRRHVARVGPLPAPLKLEVHPYCLGQGLPCTNDCRHCTRREDRRDLQNLGIQGINPDRLIPLIESLAGRGVHDVVLSGNSTEPLLYPAIVDVVRAVKEGGLGITVFSNFFHGEQLLEAVPWLGDGDVVRISLDAGTARTYDLIHDPRSRHAFSRTLDNIEALIERRRRHGRNFHVEISFVLMSLNARSTEITAVVNWARDHAVDRVRFSHLLCPRIGNGEFDSSQLLSKRETVQAVALLKHLQTESADSGCEIQILEDEPQQPQKPFRACHHWKLVGVLGASGRFFPCTSVSLVRLMDRLGRGDINSPDFDFWEFCNDPSKWADLCPQSCAGGQLAECTRFEFTANQEIEELAAME